MRSSTGWKEVLEANCGARWSPGTGGEIKGDRVAGIVSVAAVAEFEIPAGWPE
ncbi:MAG: hypothetical protein U1F77_10705 [Kiritimatiellia bacterium]